MTLYPPKTGQNDTSIIGAGTLDTQRKHALVI